MPSRKKLQGKARKAEKEQTAKETLSHDSCDHQAPWLAYCLDDDWETCKNSIADLLSEVFGLYEEGTGFFCSPGLFQIIPKLCNKYHNLIFSDFTRRKICLELLLASGTKAALSEAEFAYILLKYERECSFLRLPTRVGVPYCTLIACLYKELERYDSETGYNMSPVETTSFVTTMFCPREMTRFFHRRNSCDCLKDLHYKLKDGTKRVSYCWNCTTRKDTREMNECSHCKVTQYCSQECAVADWQRHKINCKRYRKLRESEKMFSAEAQQNEKH